MVNASYLTWAILVAAFVIGWGSLKAAVYAAEESQVLGVILLVVLGILAIAFGANDLQEIIIGARY